MIYFFIILAGVLLIWGIVFISRGYESTLEEKDAVPLSSIGEIDAPEEAEQKDSPSHMNAFTVALTIGATVTLIV